MSKVHGGWLVAKTLHELGVREIFSLSGGHINPIYDACIDFNIRIIDTHHEQGAAMAADAYGRVKRQPGKAYEAYKRVVFNHSPVNFAWSAPVKPDTVVPTLLIWGEEDPALPVQLAYRLKRVWSEMQLYVLPNCGHFPHEEKPKEVINTLLLDFLSPLLS